MWVPIIALDMYTHSQQWLAAAWSVATVVGAWALIVAP